MAVQDYYANNQVNVGEKTEPGSNAAEVVRYIGSAAIVAADDNNSEYLIAANVPSSFRPSKITVMCDGITGGTDYDLGVYDPANGDAADADLFMDGQSLATASRTLDGLANVGIEKIGQLQTIAELLGLTASTAKPAYDIVLKGNVAGTADGDVVVIIEGLAA